MTVALALVTVGAGGLGAVIRYLVSLGLARVSDSRVSDSRESDARASDASASGSRVSDASASDAERFPWAVLVVNVAGSAIGGVVLGLAQHAGIPADLQLVILTGLCGGLTTFSTFSVETVQLARAGRWRAATLSVGANLLLGLGACAIGFALAA